MDVGEIKEPCLGVCPNPPPKKGAILGGYLPDQCNVYGISGERSICSTLFGRWPQRCPFAVSIAATFFFLLRIAVALLYLLGSMFALRACDTAYCYRYGVVCGRLCLLNTSVSPAKTAEVITVLWSMVDSGEIG